MWSSHGARVPWFLESSKPNGPGSVTAVSDERTDCGNERENRDRWHGFEGGSRFLEGGMRLYHATDPCRVRCGAPVFYRPAATRESVPSRVELGTGAGRPRYRGCDCQRRAGHSSVALLRRGTLLGWGRSLRRGCGLLRDVPTARKRTDRSGAAVGVNFGALTIRPRRPPLANEREGRGR